MPFSIHHKIQTFSLLVIGAATVIAAIILWTQPATRAQAILNCSAAFTIDETLPNGARWQMCWEHRSLDGIVYRDVHYTPPGGTTRQVLFQASIAQVHVPYDDNSARFHDITDDGFGNTNLNDLTPAECPDGRLLRFGSKDALCLQIQSRGHAFKSLTHQQQGYALSLLSVSTSGEYNYIPQWRFFDDGTIEPSMGASGKLQRFGSDTRYGWPVRANGTTGISHTHNYYWRLDFDLGESGTDDLFEEIEFTPSADRTQRTRVTTPFLQEAARSIASASMRSWRIRDAALNTDGHALSYHLEPLYAGHRDVGPAFEPFTANDIYITKVKSCEKYVSHNPTTGGCGDDVSDFANGESLTGADIVLWYGITFHHIPRDEDEPLMPAHWDGFQLVPRDWSARNPLIPVEPTPTVTATATPLPTNTNTPTPTNTPSPTMTQTPIPTATATPLACQPGDVTCDGAVDAGDALFIMQYRAGVRTGGSQVPVPQGVLFLPACDVDGDGVCAQADALWVMECTVGRANEFCP